MMPCVTNHVTLTFWDHDYMSKDDLVGSCELNFTKIKAGKYSKHFWANIYGAPDLAEGDAADLMNKVPGEASHWRGRVLLKAWMH